MNNKFTEHVIASNIKDLGVFKVLKRRTIPIIILFLFDNSAKRLLLNEPISKYLIIKHQSVFTNTGKYSIL